MQIFVFGSNRAGRHGKGAALHAIQRHGAKYWQGEGLQGQSYAIPTKDENIRTLPLPCIAIEVEKFKKFAAEHPELTFNVTAIGCGLAGYIPEQIAPMFSGSTSNVLLPDEFKIALFYSLVAEKEALQKEVAKLKTTQLRKVHVSDEDTENDYGYFIEIENELYCDIIKSKQGKWSVFFYDRKTGSDVSGDQVDIDKLRAKIVELESRTKLEVWLGEMPESNGKTNHTAILRRKGESLLDSAYFTIARSEYPDRVRYEADRVRYLIGEIPENPFILDYDADKHSGYKGAKLEQAALNSKASDFHHVCNLWIDPKSKNYVVDRCDHPPSECIPAFVLMPTDTVNSEPAQASQPTKCIEFIQHQVIGGTTFNALSSGAQDWIMGACENYDNKTKQNKGE